MSHPQGPNVRKLIATRMATLMVPAGSTIGDALGAIAKPGNIGVVAKQATDWANYAISLVKSCKDNPYGDYDEAIAGEILLRSQDHKEAK